MIGAVRAVPTRSASRNLAGRATARPHAWARRARNSAHVENTAFTRLCPPYGAKLISCAGPLCSRCTARDDWRLMNTPLVARWVGQPVPRKEDEALLSGRARFIDDLAP